MTITLYELLKSAILEANPRLSKERVEHLVTKYNDQVCSTGYVRIKGT